MKEEIIGYIKAFVLVVSVSLFMVGVANFVAENMWLIIVVPGIVSTCYITYIVKDMFF